MPHPALALTALLAPTLVTQLGLGLGLGLGSGWGAGWELTGPAEPAPSSEAAAEAEAEAERAPEPEATDAAAPEPATPTSASAADEQPTAATDEPGASPTELADVVLPCGLRVIAAKDASLPVAAVVLAIEVGTRDDPDNLPGLVHALAYHLQQGNRELAPGEAIATAHDVGGLAAMAVGPAQVRFESLVPISQLDEMLRIEALRLRAPNTGRELWLKSLSYARNDDAVKLVVPREVAAAAWDEPGLAHDGRAVSRGLGDMLDQALGAQLARLFDYRNATLIVVGPDDPQALVARVTPLFADLGERPRKPATAATPPASPSGPRVVRQARQNGDTMVWAVPGEPAARAWAQVLCGTLNRQPRAADEDPQARVRCTYADDPRRPLLVLRAIGYDPALGPEPLIAARLARVADADAEPELAVLVEGQRQRIADDLAYELRGPLELASYLAGVTPATVSSAAGLRPRPRAELLGLPLLPAPGDGESLGTSAAAGLVAAIPSLLDTRQAVLLLAPEQPVPPPVHPPTGPEPGPAPGPAAAEPNPAPAADPAADAEETP